MFWVAKTMIIAILGLIKIKKYNRKMICIIDFAGKGIFLKII